MNDIYDLVDGNYLSLALFTDCDDRMVYEVQRNRQIQSKKHSFVYGKENSSDVQDKAQLMRDQNLLGNKQKNNGFFRLISGNKIKQQKWRDWVWIFSLLMSNLIWIMKIKEKRIFLKQQCF